MHFTNAKINHKISLNLIKTPDFLLAVTDVRSNESPGLTYAAVPPFLLEAANGSAAPDSVAEVERLSRAGKLFLKSLARNVCTVPADSSL